MKSFFKYSVIASAMLLAQQASAVDIVITGSTAFRSAGFAFTTGSSSNPPSCTRFAKFCNATEPKLSAEIWLAKVL